MQCDARALYSQGAQRCWAHCCVCMVESMQMCRLNAQRKAPSVLGEDMCSGGMGLPSFCCSSFHILSCKACASALSYLGAVCSNFVSQECPFQKGHLKLGTKASLHTLLHHLQLELGEVSSTNPEEGGFVSVTSSCSSKMTFFEALCLFAWLFTFHCQYFGWNQGLMS